MRRQMTAADALTASLLNPHAGAGDVLAWRRQRAGVSIPQLARADGRWSVDDVAHLEADRSPTGGDVIRYLVALEAAQRPVLRGRR